MPNKLYRPEESPWRKRQIRADEEEAQRQAQREYPSARKAAYCDHFGVCQNRKPRCPDCEE